MMVEAKKLGSDLRQAQVFLQGINYCTADGTPYFSVTDGQRWDIYDITAMVPPAERRIVQLELCNWT